MATKEHRAELDVHRHVRILDPNFLPSVRKLAELSFGERYVGITTVRPPLVARANAAETITEPLAKIYDPENIDLRLVWRIAIGDKYAGTPLDRARRALEDGIKERTRPSPDEPKPYRIRPMRDLMRQATEKYETVPDAPYKLTCSGITTIENDLIHPGKVIYALTPDVETDAYEALATEQRVAESTLKAVSKYARKLPIHQPALVAPFMRVSVDLPDQDADFMAFQRLDFIEAMQNSNLFPLTTELQPLGISVRS